MSAAPAQPADDEGSTVPRGRRSSNALPDGARLAEFEIRGVIGEGGFGIVYLVWDALLQREVAIKEYMPATLAARTHGSQVMPRTDKSSETFALGLRSFVNEAQLLASFDHPSLLKVYRFWEANGTAYMVMPYYRGVTLKRALNTLGAPPQEGWLLRLLGQLLDALDVMHRGHCYHRDIAPDNILLLDSGTPLLLDFGAARRVIGDATHALTAFLKPGYAPVEQYAEMPTMKQGPWTDLYALGSVVHYAITGRTPPESVARLVNDTMAPLATAAAGRYSERFLRAIDHALAVRPEDRPQSAIELRDELGIEERRARARKPDRIPTAPLPLEPTTPPREEATIPPLESVRQLRSVSKSESAPPRSRVPTSTQAARGRRTGRAWLWVAACALALALGLVWWSLPTPRDAASLEAQPRPDAPADSPLDGARGVAPTVPAATEPISPPAAATTTAPPSPLEVARPPESSPPAADAAGAGGAAGEDAEPSPPRREHPAATTPTARPTPRKNSPDSRCAEIITRASLGEELSAQDQAMLKGECRR